MLDTQTLLESAFRLLQDAPALPDDLVDELDIDKKRASDCLRGLYRKGLIKRRPFSSDHTRSRWIYMIPQHQTN